MCRSSSCRSCRPPRPPLALVLLLASLQLVPGQPGNGSPPPLSAEQAGVSLKSITLFKRYSWFEPSIYFSCAGGNTTNLSFVTQVLRFYKVEGHEAWQPLLKLAPHSCAQCGVYERGLFEDPCLGQWNLCTSNFSALDTEEELTLEEKGVLALNLACPHCPVEDQEVQDLQAGPEARPSKWFSILLGLFAVAGGLALITTVVAIIIYAKRDSSPLVFEEQSKMLEMERGESSRNSSSSKLSTSSAGERVSSEELEHVPLEKRHTGSLFVDDGDEYV